MSSARCSICGNETHLGIDINEKRICIECSNKIFLKYKSFVEKPRAIDPDIIDKIKVSIEEKKGLQELYERFRDILHKYDKLDDIARKSKMSTDLMERLYNLGQRIRITNILLTDMRSAAEAPDPTHVRTNQYRVRKELSVCERELTWCSNEMRKFLKQ